MNTADKQIAKNAIYLYVRTLITTVVGIYTSRIVLQVLGVEDYGVYSVIGSLVGIFGFINSTMSGATSRFITYELGRGDSHRLHVTFCSTMMMHLCIAIVILLLLESVGLWLLKTQLYIPEDRIIVAHWVFQLSVFSSLVGITQVPYTACMIAHERFKIYAFLDMFSALAKLAILYWVAVSSWDRLFVYSFLMLLISLMTCLYARIYCIRRFPESHFHWLWEKETGMAVFRFSTYNLFGNMGVTINTHGTNIIANHFWGIVLNAAIGVSNTFSGCISSFSNNIMSVMRPQITKSYAKQEYEQFQYYMEWAIKIILIAYSFVAIPAFSLMPEVLQIWLKTPPEYTLFFCRILLINLFFETWRYVLTMGLHATGRVRTISICNSILFCTNLIVLYILVKNGLNPSYLYVSLIVVNFILGIIDLELLKQYVGQVDVSKLYWASFNVIFILLGIWVSVYTVGAYIELPLLMKVVVLCCISSVSLVILSYSFCLNSQQRSHLRTIIKTKYLSRWKRF